MIPCQVINTSSILLTESEVILASCMSPKYLTWWQHLFMEKMLSQRSHHYKIICLSHPQPVKGETNKIPNCKVKTKIYTTYKWMGIFTKFFETFSPILFFVGTFISESTHFHTLLPKKRKQSIESRLHRLPDFVEIYFAMRAYCQLLLQTWDACLITDDYHRKVLP